MTQEIENGANSELVCTIFEILHKTFDPTSSGWADSTKSPTPYRGNHRAEFTSTTGFLQ